MGNGICAVVEPLADRGEGKDLTTPGEGVPNADGIQTFIGIDLRKDSLTCCARNTSGRELGVGRIPTRCRNRILNFVDGWPRPLSAAFEAVGFYRWLWFLLEPYVDFLSRSDANGISTPSASDCAARLPLWTFSLRTLSADRR